MPGVFGGDAEVVEALVCKTSLSGFESRRYLQLLEQILNLLRLMPGLLPFYDSPKHAMVELCSTKQIRSSIGQGQRTD
jgi:hypothetical protein